MAKPTITPPISTQYPVGKPVARLQGMTYPHVVAPAPGAFAAMKSGLPKLPAVTQLFHKPRTNGNG